MRRRTFIACSIATGLSRRPTPTRADAPAVDLDVIDCHTHFYDPSRPQGVPWPSKNTSLYRTVLPKDLRAEKQFKAVTGTIVVEASPWVEDNAWLLDLAKHDPFIVGIVGNLMPGDPQFAAQLKRFVADPLFRGIRISSATLKRLLEQNDLSDLKRLVEHDLSLDVNGGAHFIGPLASRLPDLRIVLNHVGNVRITSEAPPDDWQTDIRATVKHRNVFCKVSALTEGAVRNGHAAPVDLDFYRPYIDVVWNAFGDERVIYGSNWPVSERGADYVIVQRLVFEYAAEKGDAVLKQFCSLNAKRAYQWVERPGRRS